MKNNKKFLSIIGIFLLGLSGCNFMVAQQSSSNSLTNSTTSNDKVSSTTSLSDRTSSSSNSSSEIITSSSSSTNDVNDEMNFDFPDVNTFKTPLAYSNPSTENWTYQAKVEDNYFYIYVVQNVVSSLEKDSQIDLTKNHVLVKSNVGDFILCSNGAYSLANVSSNEANYYVDINNNKTEYYFKIEVNNISTPINVTFYSYDTSINDLKDKSLLVKINDVYYKTHFIDKLYVNDKIGFKPESLYQTPSEYQSPVPNKWGYAMQSAKEGLYIYVYQNVEEVKYGTASDSKWQNDTHVEFSIFHHSFGYGASHGGLLETYAAIWPDKTYYINDQRNVLGVDLESSVVTEGRVEYRFFIRFNNNLDNPQDGPYAFVKVRAYDPSDNKEAYSSDDVIEYRDNRFVHTIRGDSLFAYEKITYIDNPYENAYLNSRINKWNNKGFNNVKDLTLFIGDSYFEDDNWWKNFYTDFNNKACFTSAIGGTKVVQWLNWIPSLVDTFAFDLENIVIHLGYNDVNLSQIPASELEKYLEQLFALLHEKYPDVNIYYFGIGTSYWFKTSNKTVARETDDLTKEFAKTCYYVTYIDMDEIYNQYMNETNNTLESFFKDGTHPKDENYKYLIDALINSGCVIADK